MDGVDLIGIGGNRGGDDAARKSQRPFPPEGSEQVGLQCRSDMGDETREEAHDVGIRGPRVGEVIGEGHGETRRRENQKGRARDN